MKLIIRVIFFLTIALKLSTPSYSFYDIYGDMNFLYDGEFTGKVIVSSKFFNYTNTNAQFNFNYSLTTRSEFTEGEQLVVDWRFFPIVTKSLPAIFVDLWNSYLGALTKKIIYTVKLPSDHFLVFDKKGKRMPLGYFFEILLPIIDIEKNQYHQRYGLDIVSKLKTDHLSLEITGWDFLKNTRSLDAEPLILLETNMQLISEIYSNYSKKQNQKTPTIFWMQHANIFQVNEYKQVQNEAVLTGMYFLETGKKQLSKAIVIGKMSVEVPYEYQNFKMPFTIQLEGQFDVKLRDRAKMLILDDKNTSNKIQLNTDNNIDRNTY